MRRLAAIVLIALAAAPAALADGGPLYVVQDGIGAAGGAFHYVAVPAGGRTVLEKIARGGDVLWAEPVAGSWGLPAVGTLSPVVQGLSHDGKTLVLSVVDGRIDSSPSRFLVFDLSRGFEVRERITLPGYFSYDALSPDGSRLYLIQYVHGASGDTEHYLVRAYDLRTRRLLPEQIADRTQWQSSSTMDGTPVTRVTSADGRRVFTLYSNPSGKPFVHALDTVAATAHCINLPSSWADAVGRGLVTLSLRGGDGTLVIRRGGGRGLDVSVGTWRMSAASSPLPWAWIGGAIAGGLALLLAAALLLRRRTHAAAVLAHLRRLAAEVRLHDLPGEAPAVPLVEAPRPRVADQHGQLRLLARLREQLVRPVE